MTQMNIPQIDYLLREGRRKMAKSFKPPKDLFLGKRTVLVLCDWRIHVSVYHPASEDLKRL